MGTPSKPRQMPPTSSKSSIYRLWLPILLDYVALGPCLAGVVVERACLGSDFYHRGVEMFGVLGSGRDFVRSLSVVGTEAGYVRWSCGHSGRSHCGKFPLEATNQGCQCFAVSTGVNRLLKFTYRSYLMLAIESIKPL
jgi:hypothetical protein